jgi:hypothetical protein
MKNNFETDSIHLAFEFTGSFPSDTASVTFTTRFWNAFRTWVFTSFNSLGVIAPDDPAFRQMPSASVRRASC